MFTNYHHQHAFVVRCKTQEHWAKRYYFDELLAEQCPRCNGPVKVEPLHVESPALKGGGKSE